MKHLIIALIVASTMVAIQANAEDSKKPKKLADWITVTSFPKKVKVGEEAEITLKVRRIKKGHLIGGDMHFFKGPSYGGFLKWAAPQKITKKADEYTFKFRIDEKAGMSGVAVLFYVGEKAGYANRKKEVWLKGITVEQAE